MGDKAKWGYQEHLLADIRDYTVQANYFIAKNTSMKVSRSDWQTLVRGAPKPPLRPGDEEPEIQFATKDELRQLFGGRKPRGRRK